MALTPSTMVSLGTTAPDFLLPATNVPGRFTFGQVRGRKGTLVMFICNHCPYVKHVIDEIVKIASDYRVMGIGMVAISSNDAAAYPDDSPENMAEFAFANKMDFPYLYDQTQEVARAYDAACTPDFFLFDPDDKLFYRGRLDASRPGNNIPLSGSDLRGAIDALLYNRSMPDVQLPSMGCNIKWKKA